MAVLVQQYVEKNNTLPTPWEAWEIWHWEANGWCSSENARLSPMRRGFKSRRETPAGDYVVDSLLLRGVFSGFSGFSTSAKINISKFQFHLRIES